MAESHISMNDLYKRVGSLGTNELILDVRTPDEFRSGHVPGSRNIPHDQVRAYSEELRKYSQVYIHCQAGKRAQVATDELQKLGLTNLICVSGSGMGDWIAAGFPIER